MLNYSVALQETHKKDAEKKKKAEKALEDCDKLPWYESVPNTLFGWTGWNPFDCKAVKKAAKDKKSKTSDKASAAKNKKSNKGTHSS